MMRVSIAVRQRKTMKLQQSDIVKLGLKYLAIKGPQDVVVGSGVHCLVDKIEIVFKDADDHLGFAGTKLSAQGCNKLDPVNHRHVLYENDIGHPLLASVET